MNASAFAYKFFQKLHSLPAPRVRSIPRCSCRSPSFPHNTTHSHEYPEPTPTGGGISGSLKIIAALGVIIFASMGALLVFQVIDQPLFQDLAVKIGLILLILAGTAVAIGMLSESRRR